MRPAWESALRQRKKQTLCWAVWRSGVIVVCLCLAACSTATTAIVATILGTGAGIGADVAVEHWLNDHAGRTFAAAPKDVHAATLQGLHYMSITVTADTRTESGWRITCTAAHRRIVVTLETLSAGTTQMQVIVHRNGAWFADRDTAVEIVRQTAIGLGAATAP